MKPGDRVVRYERSPAERATGTRDVGTVRRIDILPPRTSTRTEPVMTARVIWDSGYRSLVRIDRLRLVGEKRPRSPRAPKPKPSGPIDPETLYRVAVAAHLCHISRQAVHQAMREGWLSAVETPHGKRVSGADLIAWRTRVAERLRR